MQQDLTKKKKKSRWRYSSYILKSRPLQDLLFCCYPINGSLQFFLSSLCYKILTLNFLPKRANSVLLSTSGNLDVANSARPNSGEKEKKLALLP